MGSLRKIAHLLQRMRRQRVYFDANFLIYFLEHHPEYFEIVAPFFQACGAGAIEGVTGDAAVAEVMVYPYRSLGPVEIAKCKAFFARDDLIKVVRHDAQMFDTCAQLRASTALKMLDALHYATALHSGCRFMLSNDHTLAGATPSAQLEVISVKSLLD